MATMGNVKIQATEFMVGQNHATLSDTLNRCVTGINNFRLLKSGANLTLEMVNGDLVDINGDIMQLVGAMPTLAPTALTPNTVYYIYLYSSGGTATLEASTTVPVKDSKGRSIKTGDATRRLMGMAMPVTGPVWSDAAAARYVISMDNRRSMYGYIGAGGNRTTGNGSWVELNSAERIGFLSWGDEALMISVVGLMYNSTAGANVFAAAGLDGTTPATAGVTFTQPVGSGGTAAPVGLSGLVTPAFGYHYTTVLGYVSAGTGTFGLNTTMEVRG